jgi:endonuclease III
MPSPASFRSIVATLRRHYGAPARPISRDPFKLIVWEQVAYLATDATRRQAFAELRREVGLTPAAILEASPATLRKIARLGGAIAPDLRARRLRDSAQLTTRAWNGHLARALAAMPVEKARRALTRFAMIGEPGADKILALMGRAQVLPLDSNGLRVLDRLGLIREQADYRRTYQHAQEVLAPQLPRKPARLIEAHQLLRTHGQMLCRRTRPLCSECPLLKCCVYGMNAVAARGRVGAQ